MQIDELLLKHITRNRQEIESLLQWQLYRELVWPKHFKFNYIFVERSHNISYPVCTYPLNQGSATFT